MFSNWINLLLLVLIKILHVIVALSPNSQLLLNKAPRPDLFSLCITR